MGWPDTKRQDLDARRLLRKLERRVVGVLVKGVDYGEFGSPAAARREILSRRLPAELDVPCRFERTACALEELVAEGRIKILSQADGWARVRLLGSKP